MEVLEYKEKKSIKFIPEVFMRELERLDPGLANTINPVIRYMIEEEKASPEDIYNYLFKEKINIQ